MSLEDNISDDASKSDEEVKSRASAEIAKQDARSKTIDNDIKEEDEGQRKVYAALIFVLTVVWLIFVLIIFCQIGKGWLHYSDNVIIAFLTTTTVNVIGVFVIVAQYFFPKK